MANKQIKDLTAAGASALTDKLAIDNVSDLTRYITVEEVKNLMQNQIAQLTALDSAQFDTALATPGHSEGLVYYDQTVKSLAVMTEVTDVILQVGQEMIVRVINKTGSQIENGETIYISGVDTGLPSVSKAIASAELTAIVAGVVTEDIANDGIGYATVHGVVRNFDTTAFSVGDTLWLSPTVAGGYVTAAPDAPNTVVKVGIVLVSNATTGAILVTIANVGHNEIIADYNIPLKNLSTDVNVVGNLVTKESGNTGSDSSTILIGNNHVALLVNTITGTGTITITGTSIDETTGVPTTSDTEIITIDATADQHYQTDKKWWEITAVTIAGPSAINYDILSVGYVDYFNENFTIIGYRLDGTSSGNNSAVTFKILKIQDDGAKKMSIVEMENITIDTAVANEIADGIRTGGDDRTYNPGIASIWPNGGHIVLKQSDFSDFFSSDENVIEGGVKHEGIIIQVQNINAVEFITLGLSYIIF